MKTIKTVCMVAFAAGTAVGGLAGGMALAQTTGVSTPPPAVITTSQDDAQPMPVPRAKPSAAIQAAAPTQRVVASPMTSRTTATTDAGSTAQPMAYQAAANDPDAGIVTTDGGAAAPVDNSGVVTSVTAGPNQVPAGTLLQTKITQTLSTASTAAGTKFTAEVTEPMERNGRVVIPVGSIVNGRVTEVRGGQRIRGAAALHLLPESVTLPDGTYYPLHAQVFDTSQFHATKVDSEGTIVRKDHIGATLAAMSLTTGGAAATGAVIGGGVGALVGAGVGAGVSTVWWLKQDRQEVIPANSGITFGLVAPLTIAPMTMGTR